MDAEKILARVPQWVRDVRSSLDYNLAHPEFNFDDVRKYYHKSKYHLTNIYDINRDAKAIINSNIEYIIIEYNVGCIYESGKQVIDTDSKFLYSYFEKKIDKILNHGCVKAIEFIGNVETCLNHHTVGFVCGTSNIDCYFSENNECWPVQSTVHYNSPTVEISRSVLEDCLLVLKCRRVYMDDYESTTRTGYIHYMRTYLN